MPDNPDTVKSTLPSPWKIWLNACRPQTLAAGIAPVCIGIALAVADGGGHWPSALTCIFIALTVQIGANFANDYYDFIKGADTAARLGPPRATQAGWVKPQVMRRAAVLMMSACGALTLSLYPRVGPIVIVVGGVCIASGMLYTAGPYPLGYLGLGDFFVLIFFGPVALAGTYYAQTLSLSRLPIIAGFGPGLISMAMLTVNNLRDIDQDRAAGKMTLAVRFGRQFARYEYLFCILGASVIPIILVSMESNHYYALVAVILLLIAVPSIKTVFISTSGAELNQVLASTGKFLLFYSLSFSLGWLL